MESPWVRSKKRGYWPGERVQAQISGIDGEMLGIQVFRIAESPGGGFAGQVYRAVPEQGVLSLTAREDDTHFFALKVLRPRSDWKSALRDALFQLSFGVDFAPRWREEAVRLGLLWQAVLRVAAETTIAPQAVARPVGYYWDRQIRSFVEIHEWVDGRSMIYEVDDSLLARHSRLQATPAPISEVQRKRSFMDRLVRLCQEMGATGLSRQYEWFTLVSQSNVLTTTSLYSDQSEFVAVDCRPGLAVPFFFPLSPVHLRIILSGLPRGRLAHYDEVDLARLDAFLAAHLQVREAVGGEIERLKQDEVAYRRGLPDFWHKRARLLLDPSVRQAVQAAQIRDWTLDDRLDPQTALRLREGHLHLGWFWLVSRMPFVGSTLLQMLGCAAYRRHLASFWTRSAYRRACLEAWRASDLPVWESEARLPAKTLSRLPASLSLYVWHKLALSWLPPRLHRLAVDRGALLTALDRFFLTPIRLLVDSAFRRGWLLQILQEAHERGLVPEAKLEALRAQIDEPQARAFLRDLGLTIGLEVISKAVYIALGAYGLATGELWPLALAALGPIPPSGVIRGLYSLGQLLADLPCIRKNHDRKLFVARMTGLLIAPWRWVGNFFVPVEMFAYYREWALILSQHLATRIVRLMPVLGGEGRLLEYWVFQLAFNLPLSLRRLLLESVQPPGGRRSSK